MKHGGMRKAAATALQQPKRVSTSCAFLCEPPAEQDSWAAARTLPFHIIKAGRVECPATFARLKAASNRGLDVIASGSCSLNAFAFNSTAFLGCLRPNA